MICSFNFLAFVLHNKYASVGLYILCNYHFQRNTGPPQSSKHAFFYWSRAPPLSSAIQHK